MYRRCKNLGHPTSPFPYNFLSSGIIKSFNICNMLIIYIYSNFFQYSSNIIYCFVQIYFPIFGLFVKSIRKRKMFHFPIIICKPTNNICCEYVYYTRYPLYANTLLNTHVCFPVAVLIYNFSSHNIYIILHTLHDNCRTYSPLYSSCAAAKL